MNVFDWCMLIIPVLAVIAIGCFTRRFLKSVAGFLSGERCAGRYLLAVADGSAGMGLISVIALLEMYYKSGFAVNFWNSFAVLVTLTVALSGFVSYRFRETRAMTMAQFFEMRYSRGVRIYAGTLAFLSGLLNYALFPAVSGRFLMYYCRLPEHFRLGGATVSTFGFLMAVTLTAALIIVLTGGQITTMVTDCVQGIISYVIYALVIAAVFTTFSLADFEEAALSRPEGMSFFNPYNIDKLTSFNILYFLIGLFAGIYARNAWLGNQAYMTAAKSPHEQKMAGLLGTWRAGFINIMVILIVLGVYAYMNNPAFSDQGAAVTAELAERIDLGSPGQTATMRNQMLVPVALRHILPHGLIGLFCALAVFLMVSTDTTYLHSWGIILAQDVILPIRGEKPISAKKQLLLIRCCIFAVALFAWFFSFYFGQVDFRLMFFAATGTIWLGGAGSLIIGGLYSRRGTAAGAYAALTAGLVCGLGGFLLTKYWEPAIHPWFAANFPEQLESFRLALQSLGEALPVVNWETAPEKFAMKFPVTSQEIYGLTILLAVAAYFLASRLDRKPPFCLEKLLHRGKYAPNGETAMPTAAKRGWLNKLVGITPEYTTGDRVLAWSVFAWSMLGLFIFLIQFGCNSLFGRWSETTWFAWFKYYKLPLDLTYGAVTTVWFSWGGIRDLFRLFRELGKHKQDQEDNGMVREEKDSLPPEVP